MRRIDGHTHLYDQPDLDVVANISQYDVESVVSNYVSRIENLPIDHAIAIINDDAFLRNEDALDTLIQARDETGLFSAVFIVDPRHDDVHECVERVADLDALGVKLHPYLQRLDAEKHLAEVASTMRTVERNDLLTIIDCSYGGEHMYETNGVKLGHAVAKLVDTPLILAHGGGAKIHEAFLTAEMYDNIYLDTSFSLPYWSGSCIEDEFAFVMERMEMERWVWGTDIPFADPIESIESVEALLEASGLENHAEKLFANNLASLLD